jgi:hypothetical protein
MKPRHSWVVAAAILIEVMVAPAQLRLAAERETPRVFAGKAQNLELELVNPDGKTVAANLGVRLVQTSSATAVTVGEIKWKELSVLPGQTVLEAVALDFPPVRAETRFLLQWIEGSSNVIGQTEVLVYPTNLLMQLQALAGDEPLGVFDPADTLKPLLRLQAVSFQDLLEHGTEKFQGKLAMFGPFESKMQMRAGLREDIRTLAKRGVAVVWLLPPPEPSAPLKPSFYAVRQAGGAVVVAEHSLVMHLAERPEAQLNLVRLVEEALHPTPLVLPETECSNGN